MVVDHLKTGDNIKIMYKNEMSLSSTIELVLDRAHVMICAPLSNGRVVKLKENIVYSMICTHRGQLYGFDVSVAEFSVIDHFNFVTVRLLTDGEKLQHRSFFRLKCELEADFFLIDKEGKQENEEALSGTVHDISGGGMCLLTSVNMPKHQIVRCAMSLHDEFLMVFGCVVRKEQLLTAPATFKYQINFIAIAPSEQDQIVRYVANEQRTRVKYFT